MSVGARIHANFKKTSGGRIGDIVWPLPPMNDRVGDENPGFTGDSATGFAEHSQL